MLKFTTFVYKFKLMRIVTYGKTAPLRLET